MCSVTHLLRPILTLTHTRSVFQGLWLEPEDTLGPRVFHTVAVCLLAARFRQEHPGNLRRGQQPQELHLPLLRGGCPTKFSLQVRRDPPSRTPAAASASLRERGQACLPRDTEASFGLAGSLALADTKAAWPGCHGLSHHRTSGLCNVLVASAGQRSGQSCQVQPGILCTEQARPCHSHGLQCERPLQLCSMSPTAHLLTLFAVHFPVSAHA